MKGQQLLYTVNNVARTTEIERKKLLVTVPVNNCARFDLSNHDVNMWSDEQAYHNTALLHSIRCKGDRFTHFDVSILYNYTSICYTVNSVSKINVITW